VGGGFHIGVGIGVGWFPLAPGEVFVPWYHVSRGYVNKVNITNTRVNVTQITNVYNNNVTNTHITYVNQHVSGGVTAVSHETFVNARPVAQNLAHVDERQLAEAPVTHDPRIQPVRSSVIGAGAPARVKPPQAIVNRPVVGMRNPTPPKAPFDQRQAAAKVRTETPGNPQPTGRGPSTVPRPGAAQPMANNGPANNPPPRPAENIRPSNPPHPLVRPAPPVQERPEHQQNEERKFAAWQQQRPKAEPPHPSQPSRPPAHSNGPHK
jgi:hypothetical protein